MERENPPRNLARRPNIIIRRSVRRRFQRRTEVNQAPKHVYDLNLLEIESREFPIVMAAIGQNENEQNQGQQKRGEVIIFLNENYIDRQALLQLERYRHLNIITLSLSTCLLDTDDNNFGSLGCQILTKMNTHLLKDLYLAQNAIADQGCLYLSMGRWDHLKELTLDENNITERGCNYLAKGIWTCLACLGLEYNPIGKQGYLYLKSTSIGFVECEDDYYDEPLVQNNPAPVALLPPAQPPNNPPQQG